MVERQFGKDEVIFRQGEEGNSFYQILDGTVGIYANYGEEDQIMLTELKKDDFFGEMAVIEAYPRSATAVALEDGTKVDEVTAGEVDQYLGQKPDKAIKLMEHIGNRLRALTDDYNKVSSLIYELGLEEKEEVIDTLAKKIKGFVAFYRANKRATGATSAEAIRAAKHSEGFTKNVVAYPAGTVICKEGETGDCMYDIHWGRVGIYTGYGTDDEQKLTELASNSFFGEMGMISKEPRSATAVAIDDQTTLEIIYPEDLKELFEKNPPKFGMIVGHLSSRLRKLSDKYLEACGLIYEVSEAKADDPMLSEDLREKLKAYKAQLYD
jgi:CRP-like cAMP-binding protein